jgi:2-polyprenyl-6-methoxyphenol hydroxylase-like FAD-dependent oxidoreductase
MSDSSAKIIDALVVGAGPVGLSMASELTRHGVSCRIIDRRHGPTDESRALGIQPRTLEVFENMGVVDPVLARGKKVHGLNAYAQNRRIVHIGLDLEGLNTPYPFLLILPQGQTERILIDHLTGQGVQVERRRRLVGFVQAGDRVTATLANEDGSEQTVPSRWLIGCDGARSEVRHILNLSFEGAEYEETFLLADAHVDWNLPDDEIHFFLTPEGGIGAFPMNEAGQWRLVDTTGALDTDDPSSIVNRFQELLRTQGHPGLVVHDPTWVSSFRIHRRVVGAFRAGRCFVAGDAAHIHSPAGGQGMNTGIQDAYNLAWKLGLVASGASPDTLLDSYNAERRPVVADVLKGTDWLTRVMTLRSQVGETIRNHLASTLSEFEFVQRRISQNLSELRVGYRDSPIVGDDHAGLFRSLVPTGHGPGLVSYLDFGAAPHPGDRVPDVELHPPEAGAPRRLFQIIQGTRHTLLVFEGIEARSTDWLSRFEALASLVQERYAALIRLEYVLGSDVVPKGLPAGVSTISDSAGILHRRFGAATDCLYLIRPDGYVGYRARPAEPDKLNTYLRRLFA